MTEDYAFWEGSYVSFVKTEHGNLKIVLTDYGREVIDDMKDLRDLTEEFWCNGWDAVTGDQLMWMYSNDCMFTYGAIRDEKAGYGESQYLYYDAVYHYPNYMIESELDVLREYGEILFMRFDTFENEEDRLRSLAFALGVSELQQYGGDDSPERRERYWKLLEGMDIEGVRKVIDDWQGEGDVAVLAP